MFTKSLTLKNKWYNDARGKINIWNGKDPPKRIVTPRSPLLRYERWWTCDIRDIIYGKHLVDKNTVFFPIVSYLRYWLPFSLYASDGSYILSKRNPLWCATDGAQCSFVRFLIRVPEWYRRSVVVFLFFVSTVVQNVRTGPENDEETVAPPHRAAHRRVSKVAEEKIWLVNTVMLTIAAFCRTRCVGDVIVNRPPVCRRRVVWQKTTSSRSPLNARFMFDDA